MHKYILTAVLLFSFESVFSQQNDLAFAAHDTIKNIENDSVKRRKTKSLQEISIHAKQHKKTVTAVRSGLKAMDNPQSLQTIGSETIEQQQAIRLSDVVKNANGVYVSSARGGAQESFWSRGYDMSANNIFKNGFRASSGSMPEVASLDKVEMLKGSSALLYGNVTPGGILNMVTKTPSFRNGAEISMQTGSYSFYKPTLDFYGPLSSSVAYSAIGSYEKADSFRDVVTRERYYFNPSVLFKATEKTEIILQGDYLHDNWTPDFGTGAIGKTLVNLPRNTYLGATWSNGQTRQASISTLIRNDFNDNWKLSGNVSLQDYTRRSIGTERIQPDANGNFKRPLGRNKNTELIIGQQISLIGNFNTGKIKHQLFTGLDSEYSFVQAYTYAFERTNYDPKSYDNPYDSDVNDETVNIFHPSTYQNQYAVPNSVNTKIAKTDTNRLGVYFQDLISLSDKFKVLTGLRWSWQESQLITTDFTKKPVTTIKDPKRIDAAFTPKIGLVYQPTSTVTLFGSYANSFTPNSGFDIYGKNIEASIIDQYETGIKTEFLKGKIATNVTLYMINNSNLAQIAAELPDGSINSNSQIKTLSGQTRSKGIEVDFTARPIEGLSINAGYSYNNMRFVDTNGLVGSFVEGDRIARTPVHTANTSFFYTIPTGFLKGLSIGSIANYIGDRIGGWNRDYAKNTTTGDLYIRDREIPVGGYVTIDTSLGYTWKRFSVLCRVSNITNELNYTVHENYSVNPIAPRQVMTTLKYKF